MFTSSKHPARFDPFHLNNQEYFVLRDDLIHPILNGNKARKFYSLVQTPSNKVTRVTSWGGAQSNAMHALSWVCKTKGWEFVYYTKTLPKWLQDKPIGNLAFALHNAMNLHTKSAVDYNDIIEHLKRNLKSELIEPGTLVIPQGGACSLSEPGIKILADEIQSFIEKKKMKNLAVVLSAGTGTTAYYLQKHLPKQCVYTVPCVGSVDYLLEQFLSYGPPKHNPEIIIPKTPVHFAHPSKKIYDMYTTLLHASIEFDLLYDTIAWLAVKNNQKLFDDKTVIFVHSGGVQANATQIQRYKRAGLLS
ncbi:MAG: hypothetical protein ABUK01_15170 [Leptospirales bacterium]